MKTSKSFHLGGAEGSIRESEEGGHQAHAGDELVGAEEGPEVLRSKGHQRNIIGAFIIRTRIFSIIRNPHNSLGNYLGPNSMELVHEY